MFYKKNGMPEEGEIILGTVKKILYHSVFVSLDEYRGLDGMIHISEISPGRIRNIRDYVKEGKQVVCKVLKVQKNGHIDLSIRRVGTNQRINKVADFKQEVKAEKLLDFIGKKLEKKLEEMYKEVGYALRETYGSLNKAFERLVLEPEDIKELNLQKKLEQELINTVLEKIKPKKVEIKGILNLELPSSNGATIIKKILTKLQRGEIIITYISAPKYKINVQASDYKTAEGLVNQLQEDAIKEIESHGGTGSFKKLK
jgi:translation initiation factor 2 subunit 1